MDTKRISLSFLLILILIILSGVAAYLLTPFGVATTPDSLNYFDVALNIRHGNGVVQTEFDYHSEDEFIPLTAWPPLYPAFLSLFARGAIYDLPMRFRVVNAFLMASLATIFFLTTRLLSDDLTAFLATIPVLFNQAVLTVYTYAWSETLFIPLSFLAFSLYIRRPQGAGEQKKEGFFLVMATAVAVLAFYTRYVGVSIILSLILSVLLSSYETKRKFLHTVAILALFSLGALPLVFRNMLASGTFSGTARQVSEYGLTDVVSGFLWDLPRLFVPENGWLLTFLLFAALCVLLGFWLHRWNAVRSKRGRAAPVGQNPALSALAWAGVYTAAIIALRASVEFDALGVRLMSPMAPLLIFAAALTLKSFLQKVSTMGQKCALILVLTGTLFLVFNGTFMIVKARNNWSSHYTPMFYDSKYMSAYTNFTAMPARPDLNKNSSLLLVKGQILGTIKGSTSDPVIFIFGKPILLDRITLKYDRIFYIDLNNYEKTWKLKSDENLHGKGFILVFEKKEILESIKDYYGFKVISSVQFPPPLNEVYAYAFSL